MGARECSPMERANCPLRTHFKDWHHLYFSRRRVERDTDWADWRNDPTNGRTVCRYIHNAIHDSGYFPELPSKGEMLQDLANGYIAGAQDEYQRQLNVAEIYLGGQEDERAV
jgi:hypothetical protein